MNPLKSHFRKKTKYPVKLCQRLVYNLPRHMRLVHEWSDGDSKYVKALCGLQKSYLFKKENSVKIAKTKDSQSRCSNFTLTATCLLLYNPVKLQ